jgi:hypothetical protein
MRPSKDASALVDPDIRIITTVNILCQQRDWWGKVIISSSDCSGQVVGAEGQGHSGGARLSSESRKNEKFREELIEKRRTC